MIGTIDFHCHILPGVDDGSKSPEESLAMLRMEAAQGVSHIVATPHFYPQYDTPAQFLARRTAAEAALRQVLQQNPQLPDLSIGAEVYYFNGISDSDALSQLTIDRGRYLLVEMPGAPWSDRMYRELEDLYVKRGIMPIIAHVDRYISRFRTHGIPQRLESLPVLVQANASFFLRRSTASMALRMLKKGQIHLLGSDAHNTTSRQPNLGDALSLIERRLGSDFISAMHQHGQHVLSDIR